MKKIKFTITQLEKLPKEEIKFVGYGNLRLLDGEYVLPYIYKTQPNKKNEGKYVSVIDSVKHAFPQPLGVKFKDQQIIHGYRSGKLTKITIDTSKPIAHDKIKKFPNLANIYGEIKNSSDKNIKELFEQYVTVYKSTGKTKRLVYFPDYEMARFYYFTSPSLIKEALIREQENVENLWKRDKNNPDNVIAEFNRNYYLGDAEDRVRFWIDNYAKTGLRLINKRLRQSSMINNGAMPIMAYIPYLGEINMQVYAKSLTDTNDIFVLNINKEDSKYPFKRLFLRYEVTVPDKNNKKKAEEPKGPPKRDPGDTGTTITDGETSSEIEAVEISAQSQETKKEQKLGLADVNVENDRRTKIRESKPRRLPKKDNSTLSTRTPKNNDEDADGTQGLIRVKNPDEKKTEQDPPSEPTDGNVIFDAFIKVANSLIASSGAKGEIKTFDIKPPKKPKDKKIKRWLIGSRPRRYALARVWNGSEYMYLLEVEKESSKDVLSTLIIKPGGRDMLSFANELVVGWRKGGKWPFGDELKNVERLDHDGDYSEEGIEWWKERIKSML